METKKLLTSIFSLIVIMAMNAQIGYQIAVIDQAKGEPKANASVSVSVTLTDNAGKTICSEAGTYTTDDFGIVSLKIGSSSTFEDMNWSRVPMWVTASVDGVTVSKTQVLSVPVAEYAKHSGILTKEILCGKTWRCTTDEVTTTLSFSMNNTVLSTSEGHVTGTTSGSYYISGDVVICSFGEMYGYLPSSNYLVNDGAIYK